jgi:O-antigen/teichoic acid export membrane protein
LNQVEGVKKKALKSAKWMIVTSVFSMFCSYASNILLGRISPETLGIYSAVNVFISSLTTFVGMGGAVVLSNFLPKMDSEIQKRQLLHTYIAMSFGMYIVFVAVILIFPKMNLLLSGGLDGAEKWVALIVVAPLYIVMTVISYLLIALLEARISNIMSKLYAILLPFVLLSVYLVDRELLEQKLVSIVFSSVIVSNILAIILGVSFIKKEKIISKARGFYVPRGFFFFSITTFMQALFSFLYLNADKMFLISLEDMGQLGYYHAIISIYTLVDFVPSLLGNVTTPYFSNILKVGNKKDVKESYERIEKYMLFFLVTCIIGVITLSDVALNMFGEGYVTYKYLLIILLVARCISALGFTNTPMLIVMEKNWLRLLNGALQVFIQFSITFICINKLGILAVVLGRTIGVCIAQIMPQLMMKYRSGYHIRISKAYYSGVICTLLLGIIQVALDLNLAISILSAVISWFIFLIGGRFKKEDFVSIFNMVFRKRGLEDGSKGND